MSDDWIQGVNSGFDRLENELGFELANEIYIEGYTRVLAKVLPDGTIIYKELDGFGNIIGSWIP